MMVVIAVVIVVVMMIAAVAVNLAQHSYFNLSGHKSGKVLDHIVRINGYLSISGRLLLLLLVLLPAHLLSSRLSPTNPPLHCSPAT